MSDVPFEKAIEGLETIVSQLEEGELPLEEAIAQYEKGIQLIKGCTKTLHAAEKKVEILMKNAEGNLEAEDFVATEEATAQSVQKKTKPKKKKDAQKLSDEDLFLS